MKSPKLPIVALLAAGVILFWGGPVRWTVNLVAAFAVTGVLATAGGFFLQTWAQRRLDPTRAALWILT